MERKTESPVHILYISIDGMTDPLGQSQVIPYLKGLTMFGYRFTILSFEKKERYRQLREKIEQLLAECNIDWEPMPYSTKPPILASIKDYRAGLRKSKQLVKEKNIRIVHARGHHLACMMAMEVKKQNSHVRFLYDMRGFWPDERVEGGVWNLKNPLFNFIYRFFKKKEKQFFSDSDGMVTLTYAARDYLEKNYGIGNKIKVIPCAADLNHFQRPSDEAINAKRFTMGLSEKFVLIISGSIGTWYMPDEMIQFIARANQIIPNFHLLIVTLDNTDQFVKKAILKGMPKESITVTSSTREEMPLYYSMSNAALFFIKPVFSKMASSPTKHGELLGCKVPVVCNGGVGDMDKIMEEVKTGIVVQDFSEKALDESIRQLLSFKTDGRAYEQTALKYYALDTGVQKYHELYQFLLEK